MGWFYIPDSLISTTFLSFYDFCVLLGLSSFCALGFGRATVFPSFSLKLFDYFIVSIMLFGLILIVGCPSNKRGVVSSRHLTIAVQFQVVLVYLRRTTLTVLEHQLDARGFHPTRPSNPLLLSRSSIWMVITWLTDRPTLGLQWPLLVLIDFILFLFS